MMKRFSICIALFLLGNALPLPAQFKESKSSKTTQAPCSDELVQVPQRKARIFMDEESYEKDLNELIDLPRSLRDKITLTFIVRCDSVAHKFKVLRGINPAVDPYILTAVQKVQGWRPALQNKIPVSSRVTFTLEAFKGKLRLEED